MNTIIKRWADLAGPFLHALLFKFTFRNLPKALMPNIQIDVGQMEMCSQSIFSPPPLLKEQNYGQLILFYIPTTTTSIGTIRN